MSGFTQGATAFVHRNDHRGVEANCLLQSRTGSFTFTFVCIMENQWEAIFR